MVGAGQQAAREAVGERRLADAARAAQQPGVRQAAALPGAEHGALGALVAEQVRVGLGRRSRRAPAWSIDGAARPRPRPLGLVAGRRRSRRSARAPGARAGGSPRARARGRPVPWPRSGPGRRAAAQRAMPTSTGRSRTSVRSGRWSPSSGACSASTRSRPRLAGDALVDAGRIRRSGRTGPRRRGRAPAGSRGADGRRARPGTGRARPGVASARPGRGRSARGSPRHPRCRRARG